MSETRLNTQAHFESNRPLRKRDKVQDISLFTPVNLGNLSASIDFYSYDPAQGCKQWKDGKGIRFSLSFKIFQSSNFEDQPDAIFPYKLLQYAEKFAGVDL